MKKLLLFVGLSVFAFSLRANPLPSPTIAVSELMFNSENNWIIELELFNFEYYNNFDSICITSSTGIAKLVSYTIELDDFEHGFLVVKNENLSSDLNINQLGDIIQVGLYSGGDVWFYESPMIFGNYPNSTVRAPELGESVASIPEQYYFSGIFCIDKSPTIGVKNTPDGMQGTIYGKVYDKNNQPFYSEGISFRGTLGLEISTQKDGSYSSQTYATYHYLAGLSYYYGVRYLSGVHVIPFDFELELDESINIDIYLTENVVSSINNDLKTNENSILKLYPNPIKNGILNYEIELPIKSANCFIELLNTNGQKIASYPILQNQGNINLSPDIANGTYILNLFVNNKRYNSSKIIIAK